MFALLTYAVSVLVAVYAVWVVAQFVRSKKQQFCAPYISSWIPVLGQALNFQKDPTTFMKSCADKYGPVFTMLLGGKDITFVVDPAFFPTIRKSSHLSLHPVVPITRRTFGVTPNGIASYNTELDHHFNKTIINVDSLTELTHKNQAELRRIFHKKYAAGPSHSGTLYKYVSEIIFETTVVTIFGEKFYDPTFLEKFNLFDDVFPLLVAELPQSFFPTATSARDILVRSLAKHNLGGWNGASKLMQGRYPIIQRMGLIDNDVGGVELGVLWASLGNTIPATFWILYYLLTHPEAYAEVSKEINENLVFEPLSKQNFTPWSLDDLGKCTKLQSSIYESLRLSAGSMMLRIALEDVTLQFPGEVTVQVKKGERLVAFPSYVHYDDKVFKDPFKFQYDRFLTGNLSPNLVMPFGMSSLPSSFTVCFLALPPWVLLVPIHSSSGVSLTIG